MNTEPELLNERLERLAIVLDEIMPQCALLVRDAISLLKEQQEEIENLKQTAQSMMEGIVISTPMFHPCESCQEFNCDFCKYKELRRSVK